MSIDSRLSALEARGLIRSVGRPGEDEFLFRHTLFQETAYRSLLRGERVELHRSVANILERALAGDEESVAPILAYHFEQAGDDLQALRYFTLAAKAAAKVYANQEAIEHYQHAIRLALRVAPEPETLIELYTGCGRLHELMGDFDGAIRVYDAMQARSEALGFAILGIKARVARDTLFSSPSTVSDPHNALANAKSTLELARAIGDEEAEARSLWNLMLAGFFTGDEEASREYGEQALTIARRLGDKQLQAFILNDLSRSNLFFEGRQKRGMELLNRAIDLWKELDNLPMLADSLNGQAMFAAYSGEYEEALDLSGKALAMSTEIDNPWGKSYSQYIMTVAYWDRGDYTSTMRVGDEALHWARVAGFAVPQVHARALQAWALWDLGRYDQARDLVREAVDSARNSLPSWLPLALAVQVMIGLSRSQATGETAFDELNAIISNPDREVFPVAEVYARLAEANHSLSTRDYQRALEVSDEMVSMQSRLNFRNFRVDALMARGQALRSLGQSDLARVALEEARQVSESTGAGRTLWRILYRLSAWADADGLPQASELRGQARAALEPIVDMLKDEWRESFLATPDASAVWAG